MPLQLALVFACVAIGLLAPRFGKREQILIAAFAAAVTLLYLTFPDRFIT